MKTISLELRAPRLRRRLRRVRLGRKSSELKIIFMGAGDFALPILEALIKSQSSPVLVITNPDKPGGRHRIITPPLVKQLAQKYKIPVLQPEKIKDISPELRTPRQRRVRLGRKSPELIIVAAYGQILPQEILKVPHFGCLNIHPSLLPKYRGPSPIPSAILEGEKKTGISIILMAKKMDAGPILAQKEIEIKTNDTAETLSKKLSQLGAKILLDIIPKWIKGEIKPASQDEKRASYTKILKKEDGHISWSKPALEIERQIRAYFFWPGSYTYWRQVTSDPSTRLRAGKRQGFKKLIKIKKAKILHPKIGCADNSTPGYVFLTAQKKLAVNCQPGSIYIEKLQLEGKKAMTAKEFLNGHPEIIGSILQ